MQAAESGKCIMYGNERINYEPITHTTFVWINYPWIPINNQRSVCLFRAKQSNVNARWRLERETGTRLFFATTSLYRCPLNNKHRCGISLGKSSFRGKGVATFISFALISFCSIAGILFSPSREK